MEEWRLADPVPYVEFLHRFQIVSELAPGRHATHIDVFHAMAQLRVQISDVQADELMRGLDRDMSGVVDLQEFQQFLMDWRIEIPRWQTAALYEALVCSLKHHPAVEDVLLGIALISRSPVASPCGTLWLEAAKTVGEEIEKSGQSLVAFFRQWDADMSGFLSPNEVEHALLRGLPQIGQQFTLDQMRALVCHMDAQGVQNDRVSLIEFLRALGSRSLERDLSSALLGEVLKPVFLYKPMLEAFCQRHDPISSNSVSAEQFRAGLREMNRQLEVDGSIVLSECQMQAVGEIASGGASTVQYRGFLHSLRVVDTVKRAQLSKAAREGLRAAFGS